MKTRIVVLAAGKGTRFSAPMPKVLQPLLGKPLIRSVLDAVAASGIDRRPVVVVGYGADSVRRELGSSVTYAVQAEQLGTGHAVRAARDALASYGGPVLVLYGDQPFVQPTTIRALAARYAETSCVLAMATTRVPDLEGWRKTLANFGRVIRDESGRIAAIRERRDATPAECAITELNPSFFCFRGSWLWPNLEFLTQNNGQREYYLTDLVRIAVERGDAIASFDVNPLETVGVNAPDELELASTLAEKFSRT